MSTFVSPTVAPSSRLVPLTSGLLDRLDPKFNYTWAGIALVVALIIYTSTRPKSNLDSIPAVGRTGLLTSYIDARRFQNHANAFIKEGYTKYKPGIFRVPDLKHWLIVVTGSKFTDELRNAPDDVLDFHGAVKDDLSSEWIFGQDASISVFMNTVIRNHLTRNIGRTFADVREEMQLGFEEFIPLTKEWINVKALDTIMKIVSRTSNRVFVGSPLCRDPEFLDLNTQFTAHVMIAARRLKIFPNVLKSIAVHLLTDIPKYLRAARKQIGPIIEERKRMIEEYGADYPGKPADMLSWIMDAAEGKQRETKTLSRAVLSLNFAAIHTTSSTFTNSLYELASRPEYIEPIRHEVEAVIAEDGWTKVAMARMRKLDSFLKEAQRVNGIGFLSMTRKVQKDFTFSDGTRLPEGVFVSAASAPRHLDEDVYPDGTTFKGFRFSDIREEEGEGTKNQMVSTSVDYLIFGHGKHACPGRFFAVNEVKVMMAHVLLTYDIKMDIPPQTSWDGPIRIIDRDAVVQFRKRRV